MEKEKNSSSEVNNASDYEQEEMIVELVEVLPKPCYSNVVKRTLMALGVISTVGLSYLSDKFSMPILNGITFATYAGIFTWLINKKNYDEAVEASKLQKQLILFSGNTFDELRDYFLNLIQKYKFECINDTRKSFFWLSAMIVGNITFYKLLPNDIDNLITLAWNFCTMVEIVENIKNAKIDLKLFKTLSDGNEELTRKRNQIS